MCKERRARIGRPFAYSPLHLCQNESSWENIRMKMYSLDRFSFMQIKLIFVWKVFHEDSLSEAQGILEIADSILLSICLYIPQNPTDSTLILHTFPGQVQFHANQSHSYDNSLSEAQGNLEIVDIDFAVLLIYIVTARNIDISLMQMNKWKINRFIKPTGSWSLEFVIYP